MNAMETKLWSMMDRFFLILMLVTGEEDGEGFNIHHIL